MLLSFDIIMSLDVTPCLLVISTDMSLKLASLLDSATMYQLQSLTFKILLLCVAYCCSISEMFPLGLWLQLGNYLLLRRISTV